MAAARPGQFWDEARRYEFLGVHPLFRGLSPDAARQVAAAFAPRTILRGDAVFLEGQEAGAFHVLAEGRVKLVRETDEGREVILRLIQVGEAFGGAGIWGEAEYPASAFAQEDSVDLQLSTRDFTRLLHAHPEIALAIIRLLAGRLRDAEARIRDLQTAQVEQRVANVLLRLANKTGVKTAEGVRIGVPLTRQDLAELSGTTLSTASR
ncbi:MAG TPA: Crp/Fnr family transcriptional regulator, partial [Chloroflexota bacterium]|nr:Crp/Fnr family transcriptional regulator [Chloroflexota bacterium]